MMKKVTENVAFAGQPPFASFTLNKPENAADLQQWIKAWGDEVVANLAYQRYLVAVRVPMKAAKLAADEAGRPFTDADAQKIADEFVPSAGTRQRAAQTATGYSDALLGKAYNWIRGRAQAGDNDAKELLKAFYKTENADAIVAAYRKANAKK